MESQVSEAGAQERVVDVNLLQQLEDFFVNAPVGLQITGPTGVVSSTNSGVAQLLGLDRDHAKGVEFGEHFDKAGEFESVLQRLRAGEIVNNLATRLRRSDGSTVATLLDASARFIGAEMISIRWFVRGDLQSQVPAPAKDVEIIGTMGANEDAALWGATLKSVDTESALAAMSPAEQQARIEELNDFFDNAPAGVHFVGFNGLILRANHAEMSLLGYDKNPTGYLGKHVRDIHANKPTVEDLLRRLVEGEPVINFKAKLVRQDGEIEPVIIYSGLRLKDGRFENTRCFLFSDNGADADILSSEAPVPFSWPRND
ncbi:MAG TPA: PAS domain-containing protein [Pseudonocardia sp.]|jgi:PAS domain-containing protein